MAGDKGVPSDAIDKGPGRSMNMESLKGGFLWCCDTTCCIAASNAPEYVL